MQIKSVMTRESGEKFEAVYYEDLDPTENLEGKILGGAHGFCFCGDKFVIVYHHKHKDWTPPGGGIEPGETWQDATVREVKEESNMKVLHQDLVGFSDFYLPDKITRQTHSFCIVEPLGDFVADPDEDITEIKLIDPQDYKKYFDWGEVGDRVMERAIEMKKKKYG